MKLEILDNNSDMIINGIIEDKYLNRVLRHCFVCNSLRDDSTWRHLCKQCVTDPTIDKVVTWHKANKQFEFFI